MSTTCWRATAVAALALCAHLVVAAHTISHVSRPASDLASQHCAICAVGKHSVGIGVLVVESAPCLATWIVKPDAPPPAPNSWDQRTRFARGPPLSSRASVG